MLEGMAAVEARLQQIRTLVGESDPGQKNKPLSSGPDRSKVGFESLLSGRYRAQGEPGPGEGSAVSASGLSAPGILGRQLPPREGGVAPVTLPLAGQIRHDVSAAAIPVDPDEARRRERYLPAIREAAAQSGLPEALIGAVVQAESSFDPTTVSHAGAMGLMQLMPSNVRELGVSDPFDPRQNVLAGARHLRDMVDRFGSLDKALAAYNAGPGRVERYGGVPPYRETRNYVRRITGMLHQAGALRTTGSEGGER